MPQHKAVPKRGTVYDTRDQLITRGSRPDQFPLRGSCENCGEPIRCYDITADWAHDAEFTEGYRATHPVTPAERANIEAARDWIAENQWANLDPEDIPELPNNKIVAGIIQHYEGGWRQFLADGATKAESPAEQEN